MEIRDASGLSRFKNGFIVDNFASLSTSDTLHPDYRVSVDFEEGQLRPPHYTTLVDLVPSSASTNIQTTGDIVTLPYTDQLLVDQPYASAVENVNPFNVFTYTGDVKLYPESDNWVDTKSLSPLKLPVIEGNFLTTVREYNADQNGFSPIHWNAWKTTWTGTKTSTRAQVNGVVMVVRVEEEKEELSLQPLQLQQNKQELVSVIELLQLLSNSLLEAELSLLSTFNSCALETSRSRYKN